MVEIDASLMRIEIAESAYVDREERLFDRDLTTSFREGRDYSHTGKGKPIVDR